MNQCQISDLLDESDTDSNSSLSSFDDTDDDPNWENDDIDNQEENYKFKDENEVTNNFEQPNMNSNIVFNPNNDDVGINPDILETMVSLSPFDFFSLFFNDEVINLLLVETNKYAQDKLNKQENSRSARIKKWTNIDKEELKCFFGICEIPKYMSRNRFELILSVLHVSDNSKAPPNNRLYNIQSLVDILVNKYNNALIPEKNLCIDESMVPFLGRLSFRQYIANKRHRYGVKIFKLCTRDFYTSQYKIYAGKEAAPGQLVSCKVVMELMQPYLDSGWCLYADNWYTSIDLAEKLLDRQTHLVGTLRSNRKRNPKEVIAKKLVRGGIIAKQNRRMYNYFSLIFGILSLIGLEA
ncbi:hypothetical protein AGLY_002344 [Aphis glycines]|uniref:PiggyBac transposable element-derived protein domain-containing protein n=1 Tax=Aphis glycines TaxID=307491 RepID=A0A6G0U390_APHGL|nr:hypothetical protein AGLY_002344 [Aphis glycines]